MILPKYTYSPYNRTPESVNGGLTTSCYHRCLSFNNRTHSNGIKMGLNKT